MHEVPHHSLGDTSYLVCCQFSMLGLCPKWYNGRADRLLVPVSLGCGFMSGRGSVSRDGAMALVAGSGPLTDELRLTNLANAAKK